MSAVRQLERSTGPFGPEPGGRLAAAGSRYLWISPGTHTAEEQARLRGLLSGWDPTATTPFADLERRHPFARAWLELWSGNPSRSWLRLDLLEGQLQVIPLEEGAGPEPFLSPRPEHVDGSCRQAAPRPLGGELRAWLRGEVVREDGVRGAAVSRCDLPLGPHSVPTFGRANNYRDAELGALLEALERKASTDTGQLEVVRGSCSRLCREHPLLDPLSLVQPRPEDLRHVPGLVPYDPDLPIEWVWGYSFRRQGPVLVPAAHAFLGYAGRPRFVNETSSGTALGASLEEALLHALFEVLERDAFLMTWYTRAPARRIDPEALGRREVGVQLDWAARLGYEARLYDITQEAGLPTVWALLVRTDGGAPYSLSGAAAHARTWRAARAALTEVLTSLQLTFDLYDPGRARQCLHDPGAVEGELHHYLRFAHPESAVLLDFLSGEAVAPSSLEARDRGWPGGITAKLVVLVERLLRHHPDVVFVDLTPPALRGHGLRCVRALVPDALPLAFGHRQRRVHACARLRRRLPPGADLEPLFTPHPFA